jgi:hypothetical protein
MFKKSDMRYDTFSYCKYCANFESELVLNTKHILVTTGHLWTSKGQLRTFTIVNRKVRIITQKNVLV